jgi:hypothetical protein
MKRQRLEIGHPLKLPVRWYDHVPVPEGNRDYEGEIIGWRDSQVIIRVKEYAVVRFWKQTGLEVGNGDHQRRGFRIDLKELEESLKPPPGVNVPMDGVGEANP